MKFSVFASGAEEFAESIPWNYPNVFAREPNVDSERLQIAPARGHVELLLDLASRWGGEYWLLYVLTVSRRQNELGRYQSPSPITFDQLQEFCWEYADYLEGDGRHHFWVASANGSGQLVYDRHNLIFAYGDLDDYERVLLRRGLTHGEVQIPAPHAHHYNETFDDAETKMVNHWNWSLSPLQTIDD